MTPPVAGFRSSWTRLYGLAQRLASDAGDAGEVFLPIGLALENPAGPDRAWDYWATPAGAITFASTGGDGVHFSFVPRGGTWPVVMTVPMAFDTPNHVVGADLREFLALGCRTGYYALERLAYGWGRGELIAALQAAGPPGDGLEERHLLGALVIEFGLRPWPDVGERLAELA
ncbi:hypothetical protein FNH05_24485 [Amycolatopsis rhizosphaerae]|uniref:Uncharacterized protein n=1 Tax=Amycolatopsis rhizosphaerae TaxID=2053003 RepID=A0A558BNQ7_9PSEU|nr:hypothetical protein [Amycolatopsis rhizosphaerae]TVT38148.1 hypothetical protein FNH05_24485 [Amycolatopsis rhizosphaerae]